jgi:hypothetical protein
MLTTLLFLLVCCAAGAVSVILVKLIAPPALSELILQVLFQGPPAKLQDYKDVNNFLAFTRISAAVKRWMGLGLCGLFTAVALLPTRYLESVVSVMKELSTRDLPPLSPAGDRLVFLAIAFIVGPVVIVTARNVHIQAVVIWVRRFHQRQHAWGIHRQLDLACNGIASLITLQDSTVPVSLWVGIHTFIGGYVVTLVVLNVLVLLGMLVLLAMRDPALDWTAIAVATLTLLVVGSLCFWLLRRKAVVRVREHSPQKALLKRIRSIRKHPIFAGGRLIVRCPENDTSWRDVIRLGIGQADAVVVDLTSFSENVVWELMSALATHPPSKILLLRSDETIVDRQSLLRLVNFHGCDATAILGCRRLVYPAGLSGRGHERTKQEFIERLRRNLAACLISTRQKNVPPYPIPSS